MKNFNSLIFIAALACCSLSVIAAEAQKPAHDYVFRKAVADDAQGILDLMNTHAYKDSDKIVIVPEKFRLAYIQSAINDGRLFIACCNGEIIGYKKLFCITEANELEDTLSNELRCRGTKPIACASISIDDLTPQHIDSEEMIKIISLPATYIYNGADFTHPDHRGKKVNGDLTQYALNAESKVILEHMLDQKSTHLIVAFGLTRANAGIVGNVLDGRTRGILRQVIHFAQTLAKSLDSTAPSRLLLSRYHAFKPSFDPKSTECKPLSDDKAIPGYGCLIAYALDINH